MPLLIFGKHQMSQTVLAIGLEPTQAASLGGSVHLVTVPEAEKLLQNEEVGTVILDSRATSSLDDDIQRLLAATSITTRFVLISATIASEADYSGMGIETLEPPVELDDLRRLI
jgi:hypothetical protein